MSTKKERRELSKPDMFQLKMREKIYEIIERPGILLASLGVIIILVVGYFGMEQFRTYQLNKRTDAISSIDIAYQKARENFEKTAETLRNEQTKAQSKIVELKSKKSLSEKEKTELAKLEKEVKESTTNIQTMETEAFKSFDEKYFKLFKENPDSQEGIRAAIYSASFAIDRKDFSKATQTLEEALKHVSKDSLFYNKIKELYVNTLTESNNHEKALTELDQLISTKNKKEKASFLLIKGQILITLNKKEEAKKLLEDMINQYSGSDEELKAKVLKALL